ncbi:MAG: M24 family metallopeptidase [Candidatus Gastranaerophilales bacterium]|nr:M24 family metallopeptidase [Candidatus Gastranaerophilales bacterium]
MSKLSDLRRLMLQDDLDYFLVPSTDEYLNEYVPIEENSRYHITGFKGSTGDVLVGEHDAFLFVDGRYHTQADEEVYKSLIDVIKLQMGQSQKEAIIEILKEKGSIKVGVVSSKISYYLFSEFKKELKNVDFVIYDKDPIENEKAKNAASTYFVKEKITGISADKKLSIIQNEMNTDIIIITKLDEIAYLTNHRSTSIPYSSCFKAKAIIEKEKCIIFTDHKIGNIGKKFEILPEDEFFEYLKIPQKTKVITSSINLKTYRALEHHFLKQIKTSPLEEMKAIKNKNEIEHLKKCFKKTDKVIRKVQSWMQSRSIRTQIDLSHKTERAYRRQWAKGLSFHTIAASDTDTAIVHFTNPQNKPISDTVVLLDCGGYFKGGYATDITQTFWVGQHEPNLEYKTIYTAVLKGFLAGINTKITPKMTGKKLDWAVRKIVEKNALEGFKFSHSTGHGIGIVVHEFPPAIAPSEKAETILKPYMCFSIEPGLYKDGAFGVRIERIVYIDENYKIIPLSKAPFDEKLINYNMLTDEEIEQVKQWQKQ